MKWFIDENVRTSPGEDGFPYGYGILDSEGFIVCRGGLLEQDARNVVRLHNQTEETHARVEGLLRGLCLDYDGYNDIFDILQGVIDAAVSLGVVTEDELPGDDVQTGGGSDEVVVESYIDEISSALGTSEGEPK